MDEAIPADAQTGAPIVGFADRTVRGYTIGRIEPLARGPRLPVVEHPGFEIASDRVKLTSWPQREIQPAQVG